MVPTLWKQQYTEHLSIQWYNIPLMYFLLPGETRGMHKDISSTIQELAGRELHNPWQVDFEASMIAATPKLRSRFSISLLEHHFAISIGGANDNKSDPTFVDLQCITVLARKGTEVHPTPCLRRRAFLVWNFLSFASVLSIHCRAWSYDVSLCVLTKSMFLVKTLCCWAQSVAESRPIRGS